MHTTITNLLGKMRQEKPLILNITNDVTMDFIANGLLSLGVSPVMSKAPQEMADLLTLAQALVINLGTLDEKFMQLCSKTCDLANELGKPIVLDPVGAGASFYRTAAALQLLKKHNIAIIRGNASEIMALSKSSNALTKGVDSSAHSHEALQSAQHLSKQYKSVVVISGALDIIVDDECINQFARGSPLMPKITGTGCLLSAVVAAFHAIECNRFTAANAATFFYSVCGEIAAKSAQGPGSFKASFLDTLSSLPEKVNYE